MPGESPGRDWDALLEPTPYYRQRAAEQAARRLLWRRRAWRAFVTLVIVGVFVGWFALMPLMLRIPYIGDLLWWIVLLPAMLTVTVIAVRRLELLIRPSSERELDSES